MTWIVVVAMGLFLWAMARAVRGGPAGEHTGLRGNDPAPADDVTAADARGAVNRHSWMLGGGGSGG